MSGGGSGTENNMLRFYTDNPPGLKITPTFPPIRSDRVAGSALPVSPLTTSVWGDVGVLPDLATVDLRDGPLYSPLLRRPRGPSLCHPHRRIHMVLLSLHHHHCPRRHLDDD